MALPPNLGQQAALGQPPMGSGPMAVPTGNPGLQAQAASQVREAVRILEMALPNFQLGSDEYTAVSESITRISKKFPASETIPGIQMSTLMDLQQAARQQAPMQALMRSAGGGDGGGGGAPGPAPGSPPSPQMPGPAQLPDMSGM